MRKIFIAIALLFGFYFMYGNEAQASSYNLLDLKNLHGQKNSLETIEPIKVIEGRYYTLVFSEKFSYQIDDEVRNQSTAKVKLIFGENNISDFLWSGVRFENYNIIYFEFEALSNDLEIKKIHFDGFVPEVAVIEGKIDKFSGFYYYGESFTASTSKTITYEEVDNYNPEVYYRLENDPLPRVPTVLENNLEKEVGEHEVVYVVSFNNKNYYYHITINVIDDLPPVLLTNSLSYQIDQKPDLEQVLSDLSIVDNVTSIERKHIEILEDDYSDATMPGTYEIKIKIKDDSNNFVEEVIPISLISDGKLKFEGPMTHFYYQTKKLPSVEEILAQYKAYDPYTNEELEIMIKNDGYSQSLNTAGNKVISIEITDSSGVKHTKFIEVIIVDDTKPIFVYNGAHITLDMNKDYSDQEIIDLISEQLDEKEVSYSNLSFVRDLLDKNKLNINYIDENGQVVSDYVMVDYYGNNKTTLIIALAAGLIVLLTVSYFMLDNRKKKKKFKR